MSECEIPKTESGVAEKAGKDDAVTLEIAPAETDRDLMKAVQAHVLFHRSVTENYIAWTLVIAIVLSLPAMLIAMAWGKGNSVDQSKEFQAVFERWLTLLGPLAGAAVGVGALSRSGDKRDGG
jgi:hypothetical protein